MEGREGLRGGREEGNGEERGNEEGGSWGNSTLVVGGDRRPSITVLVILPMVKETNRDKNITWMQ